MKIENFSDLLRAAHAQPLQQRLLLVFVDAVLADDANTQQRAGFTAGHGGSLVPIMCVDKSPGELSSFDALVQEAAQLGQAWRLVFSAAMSGTTHSAPQGKAVNAALKTMVQKIERGEIASYLAFDRQGLTMVLA
jgi:hypothetical protein